MCYVILPTIAFVLLLWSSAAPLFGLFSTDWFVGENGLHYGIASGCPSTDSITIPFVIPSAETSSSSSGSSSSGGSTQGSAGGYVMWTQTGDVISKTYFSDAACTTKTGVEQLNAGECYTSATAKTFSVSVDGSTVSACVFGAGDTTCSNAGVQTCYKRALNKCIVNDAGLSTMRRRRQAAAAASESAPAAAADAAATTAAAPADAAATTAAAPAATTPAGVCVFAPSCAVSPRDASRRLNVSSLCFSFRASLYAPLPICCSTPCPPSVSQNLPIQPTLVRATFWLCTCSFRHCVMLLLLWACIVAIVLLCDPFSIASPACPVHQQSLPLP